MRVAAVVLAAGKSSRMGRNKLLLEVGGRTILDRSLDALEESSVDEVFVVVGHDPEAIEAMAEAHGFETVLNAEYERGMTSSFQAGLRATTANSAFLVLGDQLGLDPTLIDEMASLMANDPGALLISPVYEGRRGHPTLFRRALFEEIRGLGEGETVKDVVLRHERKHRSVEGGLWCTLDIDTPEDFEKTVKLFEAGLAGP